MNTDNSEDKIKNCSGCGGGCCSSGSGCCSDGNGCAGGGCHSCDFRLKDGSGGLCCKGCGRQDNKLHTYDWMADVPGNSNEQDLVEVQFKNTRKGYYRNSNGLTLEKGDIVAVEASPGHDIGTITLTGCLVPLQMRKNGCRSDVEIKRVYRKAKPIDMEKYEEAKKREHDTMIRSRKIAESLGLQMKIGDVEYQGDGNKAIFYYIADERVDFRQLIKVLADAFKVRIEMKQIGARQEAGRIGGIGPCGRELCCATWMTNFVSVSTSAARYQDISLNPQKLAGQCAKLKCCLNYEVNAYVECLKRLPSKEIPLETSTGTFYYFKADILKGEITYSSDKNILANETTIPARRAFEIINLNKKGEKPDALIEDPSVHVVQKPKDLLEQESLTRFDKSKNGGRNRKKKPKGGAQAAQAGDTAQRTPRPPKEGKPQDNRQQPQGNGAPKRNKPKDDNRRNEEGEASKRKNNNRNRNNRRPNKGEKPNATANNGQQPPQIQSPATNG